MGKEYSVVGDQSLEWSMPMRRQKMMLGHGIELESEDEGVALIIAANGGGKLLVGPDVLRLRLPCGSATHCAYQLSYTAFLDKQRHVQSAV